MSENINETKIQHLDQLLPFVPSWMHLDEQKSCEKEPCSSAEMSVAPEVAVVAEVTVAAIDAVLDAAKVDVAVFLPRLDGTLGVSVASVAAVF
jgi:hypothetical protein